MGRGKELEKWYVILFYFGLNILFLFEATTQLVRQVHQVPDVFGKKSTLTARQSFFCAITKTVASCSGFF